MHFGGVQKVQVNLSFLSAFAIFSEYKLRLGNTKASFVFLSAFAIFVLLKIL